MIGDGYVQRRVGRATETSFGALQGPLEDVTHSLQVARQQGAPRGTDLRLQLVAHVADRLFELLIIRRLCIARLEFGLEHGEVPLHDDTGGLLVFGQTNAHDAVAHRRVQVAQRAAEQSAHLVELLAEVVH